jgi:hypothetical protein
MGRKINFTHVLIAIALGALVMHLYRTKTPKGQASGK